ncbi:MAG: alpha-amylase family glycosyl hydrolase [Ekhidna sp.]
MKKPFAALLLLLGFFVEAQKVTTIPEFPTGDEEITLVFDVAQMTDTRAANLLGLTNGVYLWSGAGTTENSAPFEFEPTGQDDFSLPFEPGTMTSLGNDKWEIKLTPRTYYSVPADKDIVKLGLLLKNANGSAQTEDIVIELRLADEFQLAINSPLLPAFYNEDETFDIDVSTSESSEITISIDGNEIRSATDVSSLVETVTAAGGGDHSVIITANNGEETLQKQFSYLVREESELVIRPDGIIRGLNYNQSDDSRVTLCLQAPNKSSVYILGDFNNWTPQADYQMKKDGEFFWLEISGLASGTEYAFQYLVDEAIYIADPYSDKVLNSQDEFIPEAIYPNLRAYPTEAQNAIGFYNTVSVLETGQAGYQWGVTDFQRPLKSDLVIYELLVRDFFGNGEESYSNLIDTLSYIKSLGVNAIELMPITEFSGNDSWGYNPTFMFAPDKAYGHKNELKRFIDASHELGMAVILDMVLNQQEQPSPLILLDFNTSTSQVTADNPYFNIEATHPFNVFYDMNHESEYTQSFVDTVNNYWINEYKFDGFRFDLSKGFTQTNSGSNVGAWSSYDASRIAILKRMASKIWSYDEGAYVILEHFGDATEERELSAFGMMLWGNMHGAYKENMLGFEGEGTDISGIYHSNRNWINPHLIGYMESHDEERQMVETKSFGISTPVYSTRISAAYRLRAAFATMLMVPGPKMIWQFGELGFETSINENGRTGQKPTPWDDSESNNLYGKESRQILRSYVSEMNKLRFDYPLLFSRGSATISNSSSLIKQFALESNTSIENPTSSDEMSAVVVANFTLEPKEITINFPFDGSWYSYFDESIVEATSGTGLLNLRAGDFKIFTNFPLTTPKLVLSSDKELFKKSISYPNPATDLITIQSDQNPLYYFIYDLNGRELKRGKFSIESAQINVSELPQGTLILEVITRSGNRLLDKIIKK